MQNPKRRKINDIIGIPILSQETIEEILDKSYKHQEILSDNIKSILHFNIIHFDLEIKTLSANYTRMKRIIKKFQILRINPVNYSMDVWETC
jgi:hypothetical protein